jgi:hypothetical protein
MMSQTFRPMWGVLESKMAMLAGGWLVGATGAVTKATGGQGLSLTRTGTGAYTLQVLGSKQVSAGVPAFLHADVRLFNSDADPSNDTDAHFIKMLDINSSTGAITFQCVDEAGVVREAPNPSVITVMVLAKLSGAA